MYKVIFAYWNCQKYDNLCLRACWQGWKAISCSCQFITASLNWNLVILITYSQPPKLHFQYCCLAEAAVLLPLSLSLSKREGLREEGSCLCLSYLSLCRQIHDITCCCSVVKSSATVKVDGLMINDTLRARVGRLNHVLPGRSRDMIVLPGRSRDVIVLPGRLSRQTDIWLDK